MKVEVRPGMTVLSYQTRTTMAGLMAVSQEVLGLYREAAAKNMHVCGCNYWVYRNCTGDPAAEFDLEIMLPVMPNGALPDTYKLKTIEPYTCVTHIHRGSWDDFKFVYPQLMQQIVAAGLKPGASNREMYLHCDFINPVNSATEIQIEIIS